MKKIVLIILCCATTLCGRAQTHYPGSIHLSAGAGINDMKYPSPLVAAGYAFNSSLALSGRYSFAIGAPAGYAFTEHNIEIYAGYTPLQIDEHWFFTLNAGGIVKLQEVTGLNPSVRTGPVNAGFMAGAEAEWAIGVYYALFTQANYRLLLLDEQLRQEMFYGAGLRISLNVIGGH